MRSNFPISSQEFIDKYRLAQEQMIYLLGYDNDGVAVSGLYDRLEASGVSLYYDEGGIIHMNDEDLDPLLINGLESNYKASIFNHVPHRWRNKT